MTLPTRPAHVVAAIELQPREIWVCETNRCWASRLRNHSLSGGLHIRPLLDLDQWLRQKDRYPGAVLVWECPGRLTVDDWQPLASACERHVAFAVSDYILDPWSTALQTAGFAALFTSALSTERLLRLALRHFETYATIDKPLEDRIQYSLPWSQL
jgi:hypothetical protein